MGLTQTPTPYHNDASAPRLQIEPSESDLQGAWAHPWGQGGDCVYPDGVKPPLFHVEKEPVEVVWGSVSKAFISMPDREETSVSQ